MGDEEVAESVGEEITVDVEAECEDEEARKAKPLRDPGAPTQSEIDAHNITHLPYRAWCPACVAGKARDRLHKAFAYEDKGIPEVVFDYCFLGAEGEEETTAIQVAKDRRTRMIFAHMVPRKGLTHMHGAIEMVKDIEKLGYKEVILKSDNEPALRSVQEEVKKRRVEPTIIDNSPVGDSRSNGAAERAVQAVGEQVRVLRKALEGRVGYQVPGSHPIVAWIIEHAADVLSKYQIGDDGKTGYERLKGKKYDKELAEFGERVHYRYDYDKKTMLNKLEARWGEGFFLGVRWRTGELIIGNSEGIHKASTIKRVGAHRRWDGEELKKVRGWPWKWNPDEEEAEQDLGSGT